MEVEVLETIGMKHINWNEVFQYNEGCLYWKNRLNNKRAGYFSGNYFQVRFETKAYYVHKIIYEMFNGAFAGAVDHVDQDKTNNLISNLRLATKSQNEANTKIRCTNTSGYKGVTKFDTRWRAKIDFNKQQIHIGIFDTKEKAAEAYNQKALELFGDFAYIT